MSAKEFMDKAKAASQKMKPIAIKVWGITIQVSKQVWGITIQVSKQVANMAVMVSKKIYAAA